MELARGSKGVGDSSSEGEAFGEGASRAFSFSGAPRRPNHPPEPERPLNEPSLCLLNDGLDIESESPGTRLGCRLMVGWAEFGLGLWV